VETSETTRTVKQQLKAGILSVRDMDLKDMGEIVEILKLNVQFDFQSMSSQICTKY